MKRIILTGFTCLVTSFFSAQVLPSTENYVYSRTYLEAVTSENTSAKQIQDVRYYDGLGRPKQEVSIKSTPSGGDLVTPVTYNSFGLQIKDYLPLPQTSLNGNIHQIGEQEVNSYYNVANAYAEKEIESYSVNRIKQIAFPGEDWKINSGHTDQYTYDVNTSSDNIRKYKTVTNWDAVNKVFISSVSYIGNYTEGELYKYSFSNAGNNLEYSYKDELGHTILERKYHGDKFIDTYYTYNEYNRLAYIVTPMATVSGSLNQDILDNYCYQYRYDDQKRLVEKKLPGKGWEYMVYDKQDRLVGTQDANLRAKGQWMYTKYDQFSRIIMTGICHAMGNTRIEEQNYADTKGSNSETRSIGLSMNYSGMDIYYSVTQGYPQYDKVYNFLSLSYYDTYPAGAPSTPSQIQGINVLQDNSQNSVVSTKGFSTASYVKNTEANDVGWTKDYTYYDTKGRVIGTYSINHLGGYTKTEFKLDFAGVSQTVITKHKRLSTDTEIMITENFEYDNQNRLKKNWHKIDNNPSELLSENTYNDLSQLTLKKVGNSLQNVDYKYNIRGWLTNINNTESLGDDLFGYTIKYQNPSNILSNNKYNGNISEIDWITQNDQQLRRYTYFYDSLDRLTTANYSKPNASVIYTHAYTESAAYDLNGNITNLYRNGGSDGEQAIQIDNLEYTYSGNRLITVIDKAQNTSGYPSGGNKIAYDDNGNMIDHIDRGIGKINYNFLDLPSEVSNAITSLPFKIYYTYGADGTKLRKRYISGKQTVEITDYLGDFQYSPEKCLYCGGGSPILQFVTTSEGYYDFYNQKYIYNYNDQVGNVRLSYSYDAQKNGPVIWNENNYYPFGLKHSGYNNYLDLSAYKYSFQEQEEQEITGWYSFKWRNYDPTIGRFFNIDPLSEKYAYQSHYNFSENRVVDAREIEGLEAWVYGEDGAYFDQDAENRGDFDYVMVTIEDEHEVNNIGEILLTAEKGDVPDADEAVKENDPSETGAELLATALVISQIDSPIPGPADAVGAIVALVGLGYISYGILNGPSGYTTIADPGAGYGSWNAEGDNPSDSDNGNDGDKERDRKVPVSGKSGKEKASDVPSWVKEKGERPYVDEDGKSFANRVLDEQYGKGKWKTGKESTGPDSEYNQIKKWGDRGFQNPKK